MKSHLSAGDIIEIIEIDISKIKYCDWISERDPIPGDRAKVLRIINENPLVYLLQCELKEGFPIWGAMIEEPFIKYERIV